MSGDVQPRKRKDKRKKKGEEADALGISHDVGSSHKLKTQFERKTNDHKYHSEKIHFQNDKETGGNNYIKIFFFCLFGLLVGTVGIIYLLSQSSTDVNQPAATENSKFAEYFAGWTDDPINNIDQHSVSNHNKQIEPTEKEEEIYNVEKDFISGEKDQNIEPNVLHSQSSLQEEEDSVKQNSDEYIEEETFTQSYPPQGNQQLTEEVLDFDSGKGEETTPYPSSKFQEGGAQFIEDEVKNVSEEVFEEDSQPDEIKSVVESDDLHHPETDPSLEEKKVGNEENLKFSQEFKFADEQFENNPKEALRIYDEILAKEPTLLKALINRPRALDRISELERSNAYLKQAINAYKFLLLQEGHRIDDVTFEELANRCILRMRFGGYLVTAIYIHKALIKRFPQDPKHRNALAVTYLMLNKIEPARKLLNETLTLWPENGFALVHYGFIVKTTDKNMKEGAKLLMKGIKSEEDGVMDGMFFFHLGDALNRLGQSKEALTWYDLGVKKGLFLSRYQRSLYNVNRLKGQPWWTKEETTYQDFFKKLELNWKEIRKEGLNLLNSKGINLYKEESENLKDTGDWRQLDLFFRGRMQYNCQKAPITCSLVSSFKPAAKCTRGQIKFSVMLPNTHVWPHCGPTNCRLRSHLGLVIPPKTYLRVAEETRSWEEGKFIIFDDSFEHEVWHNGTGLRLVLIVDVWHPELTEREWLSLSPI